MKINKRHLSSVEVKSRCVCKYIIFLHYCTTSPVQVARDKAVQWGELSSGNAEATKVFRNTVTIDVGADLPVVSSDDEEAACYTEHKEGLDNPAKALASSATKLLLATDGRLSSLIRDNDCGIETQNKPRALTVEQILDILIAYHSLQADDAKELLTSIRCHLGIRLRVAWLLGFPADCANHDTPVQQFLFE